MKKTRAVRSRKEFQTNTNNIMSLANRSLVIFIANSIDIDHGGFVVTEKNNFNMDSSPIR